MSPHSSGNTYHNLVGSGDFSNLAGTELAVLDVGGPAGSDARHLGRGVHADENDIGLENGFVDVRGEEQIPNANNQQLQWVTKKPLTTTSCEIYAHFPRTDSTTSCSPGS